MALSPIGRPSRPKLGLRGHWKTGGSTGGVTVATVPAAPGRATVVVVAPKGVPAEVPAKKQLIYLYFVCNTTKINMKQIYSNNKNIWMK